MVRLEYLNIPEEVKRLLLNSDKVKSGEDILTIPESELSLILNYSVANIKLLKRNVILQSLEKLNSLKLKSWKDIPSFNAPIREEGEIPNILSSGFSNFDQLLAKGCNRGRYPVDSSNFPAGKVIELLGQQSGCGKSYLALHILCASVVQYVLRVNSPNYSSASSVVRAYFMYVDTSNVTCSGTLLPRLIHYHLTKCFTHDSSASISEKSQIVDALTQKCLEYIEIRSVFDINRLISVLECVRKAQLNGSSGVEGVRVNRLIVIDSLYDVVAPLFAASTSISLSAAHLSNNATLSRLLHTIYKLCRLITSDATAPSVFIVNNCATDEKGVPIGRAETVGLNAATTVSERRGNIKRFCVDSLKISHHCILECIDCSVLLRKTGESTVTAELLNPFAEAVKQTYHTDYTYCEIAMI